MKGLYSLGTIARIWGKEPLSGTIVFTVSVNEISLPKAGEFIRPWNSHIERNKRLRVGLGILITRERFKKA